MRYFASSYKSALRLLSFLLPICARQTSFNKWACTSSYLLPWQCSLQDYSFLSLRYKQCFTNQSRREEKTRTFQWNFSHSKKRSTNSNNNNGSRRFLLIWDDVLCKMKSAVVVCCMKGIKILVVGLSPCQPQATDKKFCDFWSGFQFATFSHELEKYPRKFHQQRGFLALAMAVRLGSIGVN